MPKREGEIVRMELMSVEDRLRELDRCQEHWYRLAAKYVDGKSVLDVGTGTGYGLPILREQAPTVVGIDPLVLAPGITSQPVESFSSGSFDVVTAIDVIEHVEDDAGFLRHLLRIAREGVFLTTPNWDRFQATNKYHFREYTASELDLLLLSMGYSYTAWHSDDLPRLPWRVPAFGPDASNFGAWIWKDKPLCHRDEPRLDLWNTRQASFLEDDRPNPARAAAVAIIECEMGGGGLLVEIGPGPGYDYRDFFCRVPGLVYQAYEASEGLRRIFLEAAPTADVRLGSFLDLAPCSADIVYSKATLEHQRDFRDGLQRMLLAARHGVVLNWYLPPGAKATFCLDSLGIYYNRYARDEVLGFLSSLGFSPTVYTQPPPGNELWLIRKNGTA